MKRILTALFAVLLFCLAGWAQATPIIQVRPWIGPNNDDGSGNAAAAGANAIQALYKGLTNAGDPNSPDYFTSSGSTAIVTGAQTVATFGFNAWQGQLNPGTVYGPNFANTDGNRMNFAYVIDGGGDPISISQVSGSSVSSDPDNNLGSGFGNLSYSPQAVGIFFGIDGKLGGGDDSFVTSGNTAKVNMIIGSGIERGNSYNAECFACTPMEQLQALMDAAAGPGIPYTFTETINLSLTGDVIVPDFVNPKSSLNSFNSFAKLDDLTITTSGIGGFLVQVNSATASGIPAPSGFALLLLVLSAGMFFTQHRKVFE